jgi:hypothetical protein
MVPELHHTMDQDVIVFNENDLLEVRGLTQGAILYGNTVRLISFDDDSGRWDRGRPLFWAMMMNLRELFDSFSQSSKTSGIR